MAYINRLTDINSNILALNEKQANEFVKINNINGNIGSINTKLTDTINLLNTSTQEIVAKLDGILTNSGQVNKIGSKGNIINNTTFDADEEFILNIADYKKSFISYQDSSIVTTPITLYGTIETVNLTEWVYIGILYPFKFIGSNEDVRSTQGVFDLTYFNYIKIKNNSSNTYLNAICSVYSY